MNKNFEGQTRNTPLLGRAGMKIRAIDGCEELGFPEMLSTPLYYKAHPGSRLTLLDDAYKFNVATYRQEIDPSWIYTYTYASDQSWTIYNHDLSGDSYRQNDYIFEDSVYFRICLRKVNGEPFDGTEEINKILAFHAEPAPEEPKPWIDAEARRVIDRVGALRKQGDMVFVLLADSHYNVNGTWGDTQREIELLSDEIELSGIIHLGDLTDGMVTGDATHHYVNIVLDGLKNCGAPVWVALGNHDTNYFRRNPEYFSPEQQCGLYLDGNETRYYNDISGLRLIFLDSFDLFKTEKYGYSTECAHWLGQALESMPVSSKAIILSHLPPLTRLQYWSKSLYNENELTSILKRNPDRILAWINGHNHADRLDNSEGFPIISIVNAKCEAFSEYKTEGFVTPNRKIGEASQEAFDLMVVNADRETIRFIRFGAGSDRLVVGGKAEWFSE